MPPERVPEPSPGHQVDAPAQESFELVSHIHEIKETPARIQIERDQDVDVALCREVLPQHRAEEGKLGNPPLLAVGLDRTERQGDWEPRSPQHGEQRTSAVSVCQAQPPGRSP